MSNCKALTKRGQPCRVHALKNSNFCFWHADPEEARKASSRGGISTTSKLRELSPNIHNLGELASFLKQAVEHASDALQAITEERR